MSTGLVCTAVTMGATLYPGHSFADRLCESPVSWVIAFPDAVQTFPVLRVAQRLAENEQGAVWRVDRTVPAVATVLNSPAAQ